ncbi:MAG: AraC family transcriptional regulator [Planctomycetota bacterium]
MSRDLWLREIGIDVLAQPSRLSSALVHDLSHPLDIAPHHHTQELQLDLIRGCSGRVYHAGRWIRFSGDLALTSYPGATHGYHLEPVAAERSRVINIKLQSRREWAVVETKALPAISRPAPGLGSIDEAAHGVLESIGEPQNPGVGAILSLLTLLRAWPDRAAPTDLTDARPGETDPDVEAAATLIEERLHNPPDATELGAYVGVSPRHLSRLFVRATGMTPHRYATVRRLDRARLLLLRRDVPIAVIADELGFASHATFTRWFRQHTGETPQNYRFDPSVF